MLDPKNEQPFVLELSPLPYLKECEENKEMEKREKGQDCLHAYCNMFVGPNWFVTNTEKAFVSNTEQVYQLSKAEI